MGDRYLPWRVLLWVMCLYHVAVGLLLLFSGELSIRAAKLLQGWTIQGSPELGIVGEILGCYLIAFGLMLALAARDPVGYRDVLWVVVALCVVRLFQRLYFADKIAEVFQAEAAKGWVFFATVLVLCSCLVFLRLKIGRDLATGEEIG